MVATKLLNYDIIQFLTGLGIECFISMDIIAVNRTSMCNASVCGDLDENDSYQMVLDLIKETFMQPGLYITWAGKTDYDYFLTIYVKG